MIAWPGSLVIWSPACVIALELARHFCFGCSDYDITQDYDYYYTGLRGGKKFLRTWWHFPNNGGGNGEMVTMLGLQLEKAPHGDNRTLEH